MAILKGNQLRGLIANMIVRGSGKKGVDIVQVAPVAVRQTKATKRAGKVFGVGSSLAALIRHDLVNLINGQNDPGMINRFNEPVTAVLRQCYDETHHTFHFQSDSFRRIIGFEFNVKSLLIDNLMVDSQASLDDGVLKVSIPEIQVPAQLKVYGSANKCELVVSVVQIALEHDMHRIRLTQSILIDLKLGTVPATEFNYEVDPGCLCIAGLGLKYAYERDQVSTPKNTDTFNPVNICAALITPGEFIPPPEFVQVGNKQVASSWREANKLKTLMPKAAE
jgi:hypothetical protein